MHAMLRLWWLWGFPGWKAPLDGLETVPTISTFHGQKLMSRQLCAEAILSNVLHYFNATKHKRSGLVTAIRDLLLNIGFQKRGFDTAGLTSRQVPDGVGINRNTLLPHLSNNKQLENILYEPYKKQFASNEWAKREVNIIHSTPIVFCTC